MQLFSEIINNINIFKIFIYIINKISLGFYSLMKNMLLLFSIFFDKPIFILFKGITFKYTVNLFQSIVFISFWAF